MSQAAERFGVLVADYDTLTCRLLAGRLRKHRLFDVTECSESPRGVIEGVRRAHPSVVLISTILRDAPKGGFAVLSELRNTFPSVRAIMLLDRPEKYLVVEAFRSGAKGVFIRADYEFAALCKCVHRVHQGQVWADSQQLGFVLEAFSSDLSSQWTERAKPSHLISKRERDVVRLVVDGLSNREIAKELSLSEHTVKNYVFRVFDKVGVSNRVELVHYALGHQELLREGPSKLTTGGRIPEPAAVKRAVS